MSLAAPGTLTPQASSNQVRPSEQCAKEWREQRGNALHLVCILCTVRELECVHRQPAFPTTGGTPLAAQVAEFFLPRHASRQWADLLAAAAALDVLAGLAAATAPSAAPGGCAFCRPTFVSGSEV